MVYLPHREGVNRGSYKLLIAGDGIEVAEYEDIVYLTNIAEPEQTEAFPVGSLFLSVVATNPAVLLGYGTWVAFATGRTLVGIDASQTEFDTVEETGGSKTHTLGLDEIPAHSHQQRRHATATGSLTGITTAPDTSSSNPQDAGPRTGNTGGSTAHNNLQPYIVIYIWKRTE